MVNWGSGRDWETLTVWRRIKCSVNEYIKKIIAGNFIKLVANVKSVIKQFDGRAFSTLVQSVFEEYWLLTVLPPAILVYRVFRNEPKRNIKILHGVIHLLALIISIVGEKARKLHLKRVTTSSDYFPCIFFFLHAGFAAVFENHDASKIPHMYSLHSWCGMATLVFFCIQV